MVDAMAGVDHATGAARRRRQRRLRAHWRHEQLSLQMLLAESQHHAAPRGQSKARSRGEESETNYAFGQKTPLPNAASTVYFDLFGAEDVLAARPTPLVEVRPQVGVQRHTSEQIIETFVPVQVLDAPVPQMGEVQVVEFMQQFDVPVVAEPVIDVPKILLDKTLRRMGDFSRPPQTAEQLLEVPTVVSFSSLQQRAVEQFGDIPVPLGCGGLGGEGGLQGFSPDRALQRTVEQNSLTSQFQVVEGGEVLVEVFKVLPQDWVQQCVLWSRSFCMVPLPIFIKFLFCQLVLLVCWIWQIMGFSHFFPSGKKCEVGSALGVGTECGLYSVHAGCLCGL